MISNSDFVIHILMKLLKYKAMYLSYETMMKEIAMSLDIWARMTAEVSNFSLAWLEPLNHEIGAELKGV